MGLILFALYAFGILAIGKSFTNNKVSESSFYVNNRSGGTATVAFSIIVSCVGASATIGTVGLAFNIGTPAFWWLSSGAAGLSILAVFLARKVRKSQAYTLPEMVEKRLGSQACRFISAIIVVAWTSILAAQFMAVTRVIQALTGQPASIALLSGALLIALHTLRRGQAGIMKLDRIQFLIMLAGLLLLAFWLSQLNPEALNVIKWEAVNQHFPMSRLFYFLLVLGGSYVVCPMLFGRILSAKSEKAAQRGALWAIPGLCFFSAVIVLVGLASKGLVPADVQQDQVLTAVLSTTLPAWLAYFIYLTLLSVIVSSADSCLLTASLIMANDLWRKTSVKHTRLCVAILTFVGILLASTNKGILDFLLSANDIYVCGVVAPVFIAILAGKTKKARPAVILASLIFGGTLGLLAAITGKNELCYLGVSGSGLLAALSFLRLEKAVAR